MPKVVFEIWQPNQRRLPPGEHPFVECVRPENQYGLVWREAVDEPEDHFRFLDEQFVRFNRDDRPASDRMRSMSVGDVCRIGGQSYLCATIGFRAVRWAPPR